MVMRQWEASHSADRSLSRTWPQDWALRSSTSRSCIRKKPRSLAMARRAQSTKGTNPILTRPSATATFGSDPGAGHCGGTPGGAPADLDLEQDAESAGAQQSVHQEADAVIPG